MEYWPFFSWKVVIFFDFLVFQGSLSNGMLCFLCFFVVKSSSLVVINSKKRVKKRIKKSKKKVYGFLAVVLGFFGVWDWLYIFLVQDYGLSDFADL